MKFPLALRDCDWDRDWTIDWSRMGDCPGASGRGWSFGGDSRPS